MDIYKEILKDMETEEIQENAKKHIEDKLKEEEKNIAQMTSNIDYMMWLEDFTIDFPAFTSDTWAYFPEMISENNHQKVAMLYLLYQAIEHYASKNYIYKTKCDFGDYYNIKLDNTHYEIGRLIGQGIIFFCCRKPFNKDIKYIDFNDIVNDKKQENVLIIEEGLNKLSNLVYTLYQSGIPLEAITAKLDNILNDINTKNNQVNHKTLTKRKDN